MRITLLLTQSLESPGGGGRFFPMAKALARAGHTVTILALHHDFQSLTEKTSSIDGVTVRYMAQMHVRKVGDQKYYYGTLKLIWISFIATLALSWAALTTPCDVIQVCKSQPFNAIAAWIAHILKRVPVYIDIDDYETLNNRYSHPWQQKVVAWFEKWMPSFAEHITVSNSVLEKVVMSFGYPAERITVVPHGFDPTRFAVLDTPDCPARMDAIRNQLDIAQEQRIIVFV
ncbi:MAG TPA: glycosyltransferase, partial [Anaerolineaceae bacterium]|nr:glycosyltransferase [Anaerolineaceae bacterium]